MLKVLGLLLALTSVSSPAATFCNGKVNAIYKWNSMSTLSVQIVMPDGTITRWINSPTKSDEAMAIVAFTMAKPVTLYWNASDVTACSNGWADNRGLDGFMVVSNQ